MSVESFSYVVLTASLGMGVVFSFLIVLSVLMIVLRTLFDQTEQSRKVGGIVKTENRGSKRCVDVEIVDSHRIPRWVIAGALAYMVAEEQEHIPYAMAWTNRGLR